MTELIKILSFKKGFQIVRLIKNHYQFANRIFDSLVKLCLIFILIPFRAAGTEPYPYTLYNTQVQVFHSQEVGIDYKLYIYLPRGYETQTISYPLVLILDPDYFFEPVHHAALILADHDELKPMILVGIAYPGGIEEGRGPIYKLNRTRDYTPTNASHGGYGPEFQQMSGGAERFLDFIKKELFPFLDLKFRVKKDDRSIVGISFGGLLATFALLERPGLFQRYIIVSPSLWYDKHVISRIEAKAALTLRDLPARAFFSVGELETKGEEMVKDLVSFVKTIQSRHYQGLQLKLWIAPEETHHSVFPGAAMRGIQWIFSK
ncbi:MAG: alpha/beta hydrolase-fold protein [Candidatus Ozemobacteraceae bacterium]